MQAKKYGLLAIVSCSILLLWAGSLLAQKGRPFQEVFPNAKMDWKVELPHPKGRIVGCNDGFVFVSDDRMHLYRYSAEGSKLWELTDIIRFPCGEHEALGGIRGALVSQDGRFVYVLRDAGQATKPWEEYTHEGLLGLSRPYGEYFDTDGNSLWKREEPPYLERISPGGKYLMTQRDEMADRADLVVISGQDGSMLWKKPSGFLAAEFMGNDKVALYSNARFYLFNVATGDILREVDLLPCFQQIGLRNIATSEITSSKDGTKVTLMLRMLGGKSGAISLNGQGDILWARGDLKWVSLAKVSESGEVVFVDENSSCRLLDNADGKNIWQKGFFAESYG